MIQMQKSEIRGYLHHLHYIPGHFKNGDESVHFEVLPVEPVHDIPTLHGLIEADSLLFADDRRYYSGDEYFLTDQQAEKLRFFIRSERDRIKYNGKRKTYEEWVMLGIPLEDYLPYGGEVSCEWLNKLTWLNCEDPYHKQWVAEYKSPVDRPAPIVPVYHTFYNFNGEFVYMGICAKGCFDNMVKEIENLNLFYFNKKVISSRSDKNHNPCWPTDAMGLYGKYSFA